MTQQASLFEPNGELLAPEQRFRVDRGDAVEWLGSLPSGSADLIITDPAYESLEKHRAVGTTTRLTADWFPIFPNSRYPEFFAELFRVLRKDAHCYVLCDQETMFVVKPIAEAAGFRFWKPLIWDKVKMGMGYHYRASYECILFFEKGKRNLANKGIRDVLPCPRIRGAYPTEKPVELLEVLVQQSSSEGEIVLDPFTGSGSTGHAALRHGRRFAGCDITERAVAMTRDRLAAVTNGNGE